MQFYCVPGTRTLGPLLPLRGPWRAIGKGYRIVDGVGCMETRCVLMYRAVDGFAVGRAASARSSISTSACQSVYFGTQGILALTL